jgi:hypothetical protein
MHGHDTSTTPALYGVVAEFSDENAILRAATRAREAGYKRMDAFSPFPIHGLADAIGFEDKTLPWVMFFAGITGTFLGFALQIYTLAIDYPLNVGGRPLISWPAFIPVAFETTILLTAFGAVFGMLGLNGLPRPYHSIFNTPRFDLASQDRFFLAIEATDPQFDVERTEQFLESLHPDRVSIVEK